MKTIGLTALALSPVLVSFALARPAHAQSASGSVSASSGNPPSVTTHTEGAAPDTDAPVSEDEKWAERERQLQEEATLTGGVGLLHMQHAQGGAPGQFRLGFTGSYMTGEFLCTSDYPCTDPRDPNRQIVSDKNIHGGANLSLTAQVTRWLELYLGTSATSNSNTANRPTLLQVIGDSNAGLKVHGKLGRVFHVGGAAELWLLNGLSSVSVDGASTSAKFRGLATVDLRGAKSPVPLRFSANATYILDNSGETISDTEARRGTSIRRIERYALGINRVDRFDIQVGGEVFVAQERIRPFVEYEIGVPINRQNFTCRPDNPSGDKCLASTSIAPSTLTIGARILPWKSGFHITAALDIGITGVGTFIEEVRPTAPWMAYLGAGWAFDTAERAEQVRVVETRVPVSTGREIHGFVHEEGKADGVPNAVISWDNRPEFTSLVTGADGHFITRRVDDGTYVFGVRADGYKPTQCTAMVAGQPTSTTGSAPTPDTSNAQVHLDCPVQALPRVGTIVGHVKDADTQGLVAKATVKVVDADKKEHVGTIDASGAFRVEGLPAGTSEVVVDADGYLASTSEVDVKVRTDNTVEVALKARPKKSNVAIAAGEIVIKQQILFAVDSATILPESNGLLTEIADVLIKNPRIHRVEVQGHTDNTGKADHNMQLSSDRANSVVSWLRAHGVASDRLVAKGYGQEKPLVPNVTVANRAKNRRVQFIILEQDPAPATETPVKH